MNRRHSSVRRYWDLEDLEDLEGWKMLEDDTMANWSNWLVVDLPLWKIMEFVSWDYDIPNIWKVIKAMSQVGEVPLQRLLHNVAFRDIFKSAHKDNSQAPAQLYSGHQWTLWLASIIELRQRITFCCHSHCIGGFLEVTWCQISVIHSHSIKSEPPQPSKKCMPITPDSLPTWLWLMTKWASVWVLEWFGSVPIIQSASMQMLCFSWLWRRGQDTENCT